MQEIEKIQTCQTPGPEPVWSVVQHPTHNIAALQLCYTTGLFVIPHVNNQVRHWKVVAHDLIV